MSRLPELSSLELESYASPAGFCMAELGWSDLYDHQIDVLNALFLRYSRVSWRAANGVGKTSRVVAGFAIWHMEMFPGSVIVYTSASNRQIQGQLFPRLREVVGRCRPKWRIVEGNQYTITSDNGSRMWCFATDDEGKAEGWHPQGGGEVLFNSALGGVAETTTPELAIIIDEMKSVPASIIRALRVRCRFTRELNVSSPGEPVGEFYDNFHSDKELFRDLGGREFRTSLIPGLNLFKTSRFDCPFIMGDDHLCKRLDSDVAKYGSDHPLILSTQFAEFASTGERMVFNLESCRKAMSGHLVRWGDDRRAAVDLSGGGNKTVLGKRFGNAANFESKSRERNHIRLADDLWKRLRWLETHYGIERDQVFADQGGLGAPIINYLLTNKGFRIEFFNFAARPKDVVRYLNVRAEMAFELNEMILSGEVILPDDDELLEQFKWIKWDSHDDTRLKIIPKKDMPDSPDEYDVIAMLFYNMPRKKFVDEVKRRRQQLLSPVPVGGDYRVFDWKGSEDEGFAFY